MQTGRIHATSPQNPGPNPRGQLRARGVQRFAGQPCRVAPKSGQQNVANSRQVGLAAVQSFC
ncbi:hypothetical protein BHL63_12030 [Xanthomonas alfalfae]|nr:hypothetical protein BHL63_12030 [Xanthomonas alfalfae]